MATQKDKAPAQASNLLTTRRDLLKVGAAGTLAAGLTIAGAAGAQADERDRRGFHIHGTLDGIGPAAGFVSVINTDVAGRVGDLSGAGWDFDPTVTPPSLTACYFVQQGAVNKHRITVSGKVLFANDPVNLDAQVTTEADLSTGQITWTFTLTTGDSFVFEGAGTVIRT